MLKKLFLTLSLLVVTIFVMAVPAKRGIWKTLKLQDGTEVRAQLVGDEFGASWRGVDGKNYVKSGNSFVLLNTETADQGNERRAMAMKRRANRLKANTTRRAAGNRTALEGNKKGLIILVNFKDTKFRRCRYKDPLRQYCQYSWLYRQERLRRFCCRLL